MGAGFVKQYHELMAKKSVRAFYYLLWICTREARHNKSLADTKKMKESADQFGPTSCSRS